ncbi:MAG: HEAT repeat domain-containing protein [Planctomycetota bacterium]
MSRPAFLLLCVLALGAGVLLSRFLGGGGTTPRDVVLEPVAGTSGEGDGPGESLGGTLEGRAPGPGGRGSGNPLYLPPGLPSGLRTPSGLDLSDPAQRRQHLAFLLAMGEPDWAEVRQVLAAMGNEPLDPAAKARLFEWFRTGPRRHAIGEALQMLGDPGAVDSFLAFLDDAATPPDLRYATIQALATFRGGDPDTIVLALEPRLAGDWRSDVYLLQVMAQRGGTEATRALVRYIERLGDEGDFQPSILRRYAVANTPESIELAKEALAAASSPEVTKRLLASLVRDGSLALVPSLLELDRDGQPDAVRLEVLKALARAGGEDAVDRLLAHATSGGVTGQMALDALAHLPREVATVKERERVRDLLDRAGLTEDPENTRVTTLRTLGELGAVESLDTIAQHAERGSPRVANAAIDALGRIGRRAEPKVDVIAGLYARADEAQRFAIVRALAGIGGSKALAWVRTWQEDASVSNQLKTQLRAAAGRLVQQEPR